MPNVRISEWEKSKIKGKQMVHDNVEFGEVWNAQIWVLCALDVVQIDMQL